MRCLLISSLTLVVLASVAYAQYGEECHYECRTGYCDYYDYDYCDYECHEICYPYRSFNYNPANTKSPSPFQFASSNTRASQVSSAAGKTIRMRLYANRRGRAFSRSAAINPFLPGFSLFEGCMRSNK